jgi:hypothetical protein
MAWGGRISQSTWKGHGLAIRRKDFDGLAMCLIRLEGGGKTGELFAAIRLSRPTWR